MRILHITPHLGGGVGKAHSALCRALPSEIEQTFVLLEEPRNRRYVNEIEANGARIVIAPGLPSVAQLAGENDIVQFEFWNHPRMFECLARCPFPAMRTVFWSHISGLSTPVIPSGLFEEAMRFAFTTPASLAIKSPSMSPDMLRKRVSVINSGFGFSREPSKLNRQSGVPEIAYLGTVDFVKMHEGFFDVVDQLVGENILVSVWGKPDPNVTTRAASMNFPERVCLRGETDDPFAALSKAEIFFYPLRPDHYGTAENALIEAMSLGLVPVVLNNPAEAAIVRHGETGLIATSVDEARSLLQSLLSIPEERARLSMNAKAYVAANHSPQWSAYDFMILWLEMLTQQPRHCDFSSKIGKNPADWFLATQSSNEQTFPLHSIQENEKQSKGTFAHFAGVFEGDASLYRLRA